MERERVISGVGMDHSRRKCDFVQPSGRIGCAISLALCAIFPGSVTAQCYYTYQQIPNPPGALQFASGVTINELGHVAGTVRDGGDTTRAFFWSVETGTYVLPFPPGIISMEVGDMNDLDVVCGQMYSTTRWYGFIWEREGGATTRIDLPAGATGIEMNGINNAGQIALFLRESDITSFRWENGEYHALSDPPGGQEALAREINRFGAVLGNGFIAPNPHAALAPAAEFEWLPEPADFVLNQAFGLNNNGMAAGGGSRFPYSDPNHRSVGMIWTPQGCDPVEAPPFPFLGVVFGSVNDGGRTVGEVIGSSTAGYAVAWQDGRLVNLNDLTLPGTPRISVAHSINNAGQILVAAGGGSAVLTPVWLAGDLTGDCHVSIEDLILVLSNFGLPRGTFPRGDVDGDGEVDLSDLAILLAHWGE